MGQISTSEDRDLEITQLQPFVVEDYKIDPTEYKLVPVVIDTPLQLAKRLLSEIQIEEVRSKEMDKKIQRIRALLYQQRDVAKSPDEADLVTQMIEIIDAERF